MKYFYNQITSPVGLLTLVATETHFIAIHWEDVEVKTCYPNAELNGTHVILSSAADQLKDYFAGQLKQFNLPLAFNKGTAFQQKVWQALLTIPYGETRSYGQIAEQIGHPKAVRAVGSANSKNPLSIVAPCHRVIGANGSLTGFAGGLAIKKYLLSLET